MDRRAENGSVVYVAHLFFGSIGGFWNGYDFQHQHGHGEEGFERLNFMREFPVKCSSQFFDVLPADDACIRRRYRFDVCLKGVPFGLGAAEKRTLVSINTLIGRTLVPDLFYEFVRVFVGS